VEVAGVDDGTSDLSIRSKRTQWTGKGVLLAQPVDSGSLTRQQPALTQGAGRRLTRPGSPLVHPSLADEIAGACEYGAKRLVRADRRTLRSQVPGQTQKRAQMTQQRGAARCVLRIDRDLRHLDLLVGRCQPLLAQSIDFDSAA
jgi:hypothetical protein